MRTGLRLYIAMTPITTVRMRAGLHNIMAMMTPMTTMILVAVTLCFR